MSLVNQPSPAPTEKMTATLVAGAITIVILYIVRLATGVEVPTEVASAITLIIAFAVGYFKRERA